MHRCSPAGVPGLLQSNISGCVINYPKLLLKNEFRVADGIGMKDGRLFTKILAIAGTLLLWLPVLTPVILSLIVGIQRGKYYFDYLMPGELFILVLSGGGLLTWAVLRARLRRKPILLGFGGAVILLVGCQGLAVVTGLASGETEPTGIWWILVLSMLIAYDLMVVYLGVNGVLLVRSLFDKSSKSDSQI